MKDETVTEFSSKSISSITDEDLFETLIVKSENLIIQKKYTEAIENLQEAISIRPNSSYAYCNLGVAYFYHGNSAVAIKSINKALELEPGNKIYINNKAEILKFTNSSNIAQMDSIDVETNHFKSEIIESQLLKLFEQRDLQIIAEFIISTSKSVLDVGSGIGHYLKYTKPDQDVTAVEPHKPYIDSCKEKTPWVKFHNTDGITFLKSTNEKFDCILMLDVVEHLEEKESIELLNEARKHCNKIIFSQIPIGIHEQHNDEWNLGGEYWQTHRSTWTKDNLHKLGFSHNSIWENWYSWDENEDEKSNHTSVCIWLPEFEGKKFSSLTKDFLDFLERKNFNEWQKAYEDGYNSNMGDHSSYFYNQYLISIGFYDLLNRANSVLEFGPGDGSFFEKYINNFPGKEFHFSDISKTKLNKLKQKFINKQNVLLHLNYPSALVTEKVDLIFSFLLCQSMPQSLWMQHLLNAASMIKQGGAYIFQFAFHKDGKANDSIPESIAGSQKYTPDEMYSLVKSAGFGKIEITSPIDLKSLDTDIVWYLCKASI